MKTKGFSIGIIFLVLMVCTNCTKDEVLLAPDGETSALKAAPVENVVTLTPSGGDDTEQIQLAFDEAVPGTTIYLEEGEFIISKTIEIINFEGTFKGAGKDKTLIHNPEGDFPVYEYLGDEYPPAFFTLFGANISISAMKMEFNGLTVGVTDQPVLPDKRALWGMIAFYGGGDANIYNVDFKGNDVEGYGYNVRGAVILLGDLYNAIPISINLLIESSVFTNHISGVDAYNCTGSIILISENQFANCNVGVIEHQSYDSQIEVYKNNFIDNSTAIWIPHGYNSFLYELGVIPAPYMWPDPATEQSQWLIHHNDFNVNEEGAGVTIQDWSFRMGRGKTLGINIKSNNFNLNTAYLDGIWIVASQDALISNNKFSGKAWSAIFTGYFGRTGKVLVNRMVVLGDNINGMTSLTSNYPIILNEETANCTVVGNAKTNVLDNGTDNILTGVKSNENPIGPEIRDIINERLKKINPNKLEY